MSDTSNLKINQQRLWASIMAIAEIGPGVEGGSCRLALSDEDRDARDLFVQWCRDAGCTITLDDMGNIFARREGLHKHLPPVVAGSHLDTQPHGGKFDGIYGVLAGLEVIRCLNQASLTTDAALELVVWTNEEGARFAPAMIASGVFAGLFKKDYAWSRVDSEGKTLGAELQRIGYKGSQNCGDHPMRALIEAHIEQGPILENNGKQIGVVTGAQGLRWYDLTIQGRDSHAGPTPMPGRRDALVAAAEIITAVQKLALDSAPQAVATVGELRVIPNSRNTIPGEVQLTVDLRNPEIEALERMGSDFRHLCDACAERHQVVIEVDEIWYNPPVVFDQACVAAVAQATTSLGYSHQAIVSGAGHDACQVARLVPTAMIFVPCANGLSHNELESAEPADLAAGCNVLLQTMLALSKQS